MIGLKFRAWDEKRNRYVGDGEIVFKSYGSEAAVVVCPNSQDYVGDICHDEYIDNGRFIVEQYTGFKDKNGKEVWEGDVLGVYKEYCDENGNNVQEELVPWGVVVYEDSKAMFGVWADSPFYGEDKHFFELGNHVEVIGNVHESNTEEIMRLMREQ